MQIFNSKHLVGAFNGHLRNCLLLFADEAFWAGDKQGESVLKGMLTKTEVEEPLTARERQTLQLIAEGYTTKELAHFMAITVRTGESHRASLMDKLNIHNTAGLTRYAISAGISESSVQSTIV